MLKAEEAEPLIRDPIAGSNPEISHKQFLSNTKELVNLGRTTNSDKQVSSRGVSKY